MKLYKWLFKFSLILLLTGCIPSIDECNCTQIDIYGVPSGILVPIRVTPESMLKLTPFSLKEAAKIELLKTELLDLKKTEFIDEIDNRFLLELHCKLNRNIIVESNSYLTKINGENYEPTDKFERLIKEILNDDK